jgi:2-aminoadipate transaminase
MPAPDKFSYEELFAAGSPSTPPGTARHAKYDFAVAYPDPDLVPLDGLVEAAKRAMANDGRDLAYYPDAAGYPELRRLIAEDLANERNIQVGANQMVLTAGSGEAIAMVTQALIEPGDTILAEEFVYLGSLRSFRRYNANVVGIKCDEDGLVPEDLDSTIQRLKAEGHRIKFLYTIPTFQNPLGSTLPLERRKKILEITGQHGIPVFEDDAYFDLRFEGEPVESFYTLDDTARVIYCSSYSKITAPGMRIGYLVGPPEVINHAWGFKMGGGVNQFAASTIAEYVKNGNMSEHIRQQNDSLRAKRDAMLASLGENFGDSATWTRPEGGLYVWLTLPEGTDVAALEEQAFQEGVGYYNGTMFSPEGRGNNSLRLCFGHPSVEMVTEGIAELARIFERHGLLK